MEDGVRGYIQVYTGNGKGKTTAAVGLAVRAAQAGLQVYWGQFIKGPRSGEIRAFAERFPEVTVATFGRGRFIRGKPTEADVAAAKRGLEKLRRAMLGGKYDIVVADEINTAAALKLLAARDIVAMLRGKPANVELIMTGRGALPAVIRLADLVTEMKPLKHYFERGIRARKGIEQ